jgi:hypothetical protein
MRLILAFFGYVKIPLEVVQLSIQQEKILQEIADCITDTGDRVTFLRHLAAQKTLTKFFRSGRLL